MRWLIVGLILSMSCEGCLQIMATQLRTQYPRSKEDKQEFLADFNEKNRKREIAGMEPIDLCESKHKFDPGWAMQDPACRDKLLNVEKSEK